MSRCGRTGYFDRIGAFEYIPFDSGKSELVVTKAATEAMHNYAVEHGGITLRQDAISKVLRGLTTLEEAMRVTVLEM